MWIRALAILLFASQVLSAPLDARNVVGSCRYEKTSVAVLSCLKPGGNWSPPSTACCKALLYAVDQLLGSGESGACCLCRYMRAKGTSLGLVMSYIMCQGKDSHIVKRWAFPITSCYGVYGGCPGSKGTSSTQKDRPVVHARGASKTIFMIMWAVAAVALCVVLLVCCWYLWWAKPVANSSKSPQSARGSSLEAEEHRRSSSGRRDSAQLKPRRTSSSRSAPNS